MSDSKNILTDLAELGINDTVIEKVSELINKEVQSGDKKADVVWLLKEEYNKETDWRKKASIASRIVSYNLEN